MVISSSLSVKELEKLKGYVLSEKLARIPPTSEYELLRVRDNDISFVVYKTGKIVYEDNLSTVRFVEKIFEVDSENDFELGSDEAGKGEWYGPLVIVCAAVRPEHLKSLRIIGVKDSKQISVPEIRKLAKEITKKGIPFKNLILTPTTYNSKVQEFNLEYKNINEILAWAHSVVLKDLLSTLEFEKVKVVIDQFDYEKTNRRLHGIDKQKVNVVQKTKGESEIPVAVASILAKSIFETEVDKICTSFGIDFRRIDPKVLPPDVLRQVAKTHFKNIAGSLKN